MTTSSTNNKERRLPLHSLILTSDQLGSKARIGGTVYNMTNCAFDLTCPDNGFVTKNGQRVFDADGYHDLQRRDDS
jgi:hypothetical protein